MLQGKKQCGSSQCVGVGDEHGGVRGRAVKNRLIHPGSTGSEARLAGERDFIEADLSCAPFSFSVCSLYVHNMWVGKCVPWCV